MGSSLAAKRFFVIIVVLGFFGFSSIFFEIRCNEFCQGLFAAPGYKVQPIWEGDPDISRFVKKLTPENSNSENKCDPDLNIIKYSIPEKLKCTKGFSRFQSRKKYLQHACQYSYEIYTKSKDMTHSERHQLQKNIASMEPPTQVTSCIPALPNKGAKLEHFYNDTYKFSVCLPTKTGSTNWLKALVSLIREGTVEPENLAERDIWYGLDRFPKTAAEAKQFRTGRGSQEGYMTFLTVRHPLARLYSAWHDKFRKGHPWMKPIGKLYGAILSNLERHDMSLEEYTFSFEAFLELVAISDFDFQRDRHWQTTMFYCGTCNYEYDFVIKNEDAYDDNRFVVSLINAQSPGDYKTHVPGAYKKSLTIDKMVEPYRNISRVVIEKIYRNYYSDFVYFNYTVDEALKVARNSDSDEIIQKRTVNHLRLKQKFLALERIHNEETCEPQVQYEYNQYDV